MRGLRIRIERPRRPVPRPGPRRGAARARPAVRGALALVVALVVVGAVAGGVRIHSFARPVPAPALSRGPAVIESLIDTTPVVVTKTVLWQKMRSVVTTHALLHDRTVWRGMHFDDWDRIEPPLREQGIAAMIGVYAPVLGGPDRWARMSTFDWDAVPQPVRALAYLRMVWYWTEAERLGEDVGLHWRELAPTIAAIVMAESWFEHRAVNENRWGNRDLGLAQCSDHCRATLGRMAGDGDVPFLLEEEQYFNPWFATRVAVVWFNRELRRAEGDVDLAIRAYHRGMHAALDEKGDVYLAGVLDKRTRYIMNQGAAGSWPLLVEHVLAAQTIESGDQVLAAGSRASRAVSARAR